MNVRKYRTLLSALMRGEVLNAATRDRMLSPQIRIHSARQFPSLNTDTATAYDCVELSYGSCNLFGNKILIVSY